MWVKRGKNRLNWLELLSELGITLPYTYTTNGIIITIQTDGGIHVEGTSTSATQYWIVGGYSATTTKAILKNINNMTASGSHLNWSEGLQVSFFDYDGTTRKAISFTGKQYNYDVFNITGINFSFNTGVTVNETIYLQLEYGTEATDYEEHIDTTINIKENGSFSEILNVDELKTKNIIMATLNSGVTLNSDQWAKIQLSQKSIIGDKITIDSNGKIIIGDGVSKILINAVGRFLYSDSDLKIAGIAIIKNGNWNVDQMSSNMVATAQTVVSISNILLDVKAGDYFEMYVNSSNSSGTVSGRTDRIHTYMTVEAI